MGRNRREGDGLLGSVVRDRTWRAIQQEILKHEHKHKHEVEDGVISPVQRRRLGGTDRLGVADDG
jgi:hypothetical protein